MTMAGARPPIAQAAGIEVVAIVDSRAEPPRLACAHGIRASSRRAGRRLCMAAGVAAIDVIDAQRPEAEDRNATRSRVSGGWNPAVHLTCHLGGKPVWNDAIAAFVPGTLPPGMHVAGAATAR